MTDTPDRQAIALFRYRLIADLIHLPAGSRGLYAWLREKAAADYSIPGSKRIRVAPRRCATGSRTIAGAGLMRCCPRDVPIAAARAHCPRQWLTRW